MMFLKEQWREAENFFVRDIKKLFFICFWVFLGIGIVFGIAYSLAPDLTKMMLANIQTIFEEKGIMEETGIGLAWGLFLNNLTACGISILYGFVPFLFIPVLILFSNALILGVMYGAFQIQGIGIAAFLVGILPHGVLEIPALILSGALGIYICKTLVKLIVRSGKKGDFKKAVLGSLRIYILWLIPLLIFAAGIEAFITPILLNLFI